MIDQEKRKNILDLTGKIARNYLKDNKTGHIKVLREKMKDFLTDPFWNDKLLFQLKQEFENLKITDEEFNSLFEDMEHILEMDYDDNRRRNTYIFEGKIRDYEKRLIDFFARIGKLRGQNYVLATIIGILLIHRQRGLTQDQIKELTGLSKGAISTNLKLIEKSPVVKKQMIQGNRTHLYSFGGDFSSMASNTSLYKTETNRVAKEFLQTKALELETYKNKNGYKVLVQRIREILEFLEFHNKLIEIINKSEFIKGLRGE